MFAVTRTYHSRKTKGQQEYIYYNAGFDFSQDEDMHALPLVLIDMLGFRRISSITDPRDVHVSSIKLKAHV